MRDQYVGDITDYLKFSLIRAVVSPNAKLGIAWYYIPARDGRRDGRHTEYLKEDKWRELDPFLYSALGALETNRTLSSLQELKIWNSQTKFHAQPVESSRHRSLWAQEMLKSLEASDGIFADPDNGLSKEGIISRKSATLDEISSLARNDRAVILIRFPHRRSSHVEQLQIHHSVLDAYRPVTVRTCVRLYNDKSRGFPRIRWFTLMNASEGMKESARQFALRLDSIQGASAEIEGKQ
ncbi:MAG: hypothetical protein WBD53_10570 [Xanthobacteraceae bacterium]